MSSLNLILASSSPYKQQVLAKLGLPFSCYSPNIDESPQSGEEPEALIKRLSLAKSQAVAARIPTLNENKTPQRFFIGVDQVAVFNGQILGKPETKTNAIKQLSEFSGQSVDFLTGISLLHSNGQSKTTFDSFRVTFKSLTRRLTPIWRQNSLSIVRVVLNVKEWAFYFSRQWKAETSIV